MYLLEQSKSYLILFAVILSFKQQHCIWCWFNSFQRVLQVISHFNK